MWIALTLSAIVVVYNNVINRWDPFQSWAYIPANLVFAGTLAAIAIATRDVTGRELGVDVDARDLTVPLVIVLAFAVAVFGLARSRHGHRIADKRVAAMRGAALVWYVLVRIPVGTAVAEELIFRGVLFAVWHEAGMSAMVAALSSSVAFGLWHITPTVIGLRMNDADAPRRKVRAVVTGAVLLTAAAGLGLTWLRAETDGLLAPIVLHSGVNSVGALAAVSAMKRSTWT